MPLDNEKNESNSSDRNFLKAPPLKEFKSRAQRIEDILGILCEGRLSPFDLMIELLRRRCMATRNLQPEHGQ